MLHCDGGRRSLLDRVESVGATVAGRWAEDVDGEGRFPVEAVDALCHRRVLGAVVPTESGGEGASLIDACEIVRILGRYCASTAMVLAVHQAMVVTIARHGHRKYVDRALYDIADDQLLVTGCLHAPMRDAEDEDEDEKTVAARGTMLFGDEADLVVARIAPPRGAVERESDRLVMVRRGDIALCREDRGDGVGLRGLGWDTYSMETTPDSGDGFDPVAAETLARVLELMARAVRVGITDTVIDTVRRYLGRRGGSDLSGSTQLSEIVVTRDAVWNDISCRAAELDGYPTPGAVGCAGTSAALSLEGAVLSAMGICGLAGYRETGGFALGRQMRDVAGSSEMVLAAVGVGRADVAGRVAAVTPR
nr:acyl-CoA dehydrogenase family protein [Prescottella subtropica]